MVLTPPPPRSRIPQRPSRRAQGKSRDCDFSWQPPAPADPRAPPAGSGGGEGDDGAAQVLLHQGLSLVGAVPGWGGMLAVCPGVPSAVSALPPSGSPQRPWKGRGSAHGGARPRGGGRRVRSSPPPGLSQQLRFPPPNPPRPGPAAALPPVPLFPRNPRPAVNET